MPERTPIPVADQYKPQRLAKEVVPTLHTTTSQGIIHNTHHINIQRVNGIRQFVAASALLDDFLLEKASPAARPG